DFHAAPAADSARNSFDDLRTSETADAGGRSGILLSGLLQREALCARVWNAEVAGNPVFAEHELLRYRLLPGTRWPAASYRLLRGQPDQRRCGTSRTEHEPSVRVARGRRAF